MGWSDWPHSVESGCLVPVLAVLKAELASVGGKSESSQSISKLIEAVEILPRGKYPDEDTLEQVVTIGAAILGRYKIRLDTSQYNGNGLIEDFVCPEACGSANFYGKQQLYFALSKKDIWKAGSPKKCLVDLCSFIGIDPKEVAQQTWILIVY